MLIFSLSLHLDFIHFDPERFITYEIRTKTVELLEVVVELLQAVAVLVGIVVDYHSLGQIV